MLPERYISTDEGRCLIGLSREETLEFEHLDSSVPSASDGSMAWEFQGYPRTAKEIRWHHLYGIHAAAYRVLADVSQSK
jgi:hypothetical protein